MKARVSYGVFAAATLVLVVASCAKATTADVTTSRAPTYVAGDEAPGPATGAGERLIPASASAKPWYAASLEAQGFYVFAEPQAIPALKITTLEGKPVGLEALAGKIVLLNFWATWCPPCRAEMPSIQALHDAMKGSDFAVMAVSVGERRATVTSFLSSNPYRFPIYLDESGAASRPYTGQGIPTTYVLDKQGRVMAGVIGARDYSDPGLVEVFKTLAARP